MAVKAKVRVQLDSSTRAFRFVGKTRSLLYRFRDGLADQLLAGAVLVADDESEIAPGAEVEGWLEFWADDVAPFLRLGERFVVWYGSDVGSGEVIE